MSQRILDIEKAELQKKKILKEQFTKEYMKAKGLKDDPGHPLPLILDFNTAEYPDSSCPDLLRLMSPDRLIVAFPAQTRWTTSWQVVKLLLLRGANNEHCNVSDYTPLSLAASGGYINFIKILLNAGAEINSRYDRLGSTLGISLLMLDAMNGHVLVVKLLLDMGSDINTHICFSFLAMRGFSPGVGVEARSWFPPSVGWVWGRLEVEGGYSKAQTSTLWMVKSFWVERGWLWNVAQLEVVPWCRSASTHSPI
ncbi:unnamed protein product [Coregonus sp. 'balchen']|nr:unnamed protein product [Coregonus sp. 'balchen']